MTRETPEALAPEKQTEPPNQLERIFTLLVVIILTIALLRGYAKTFFPSKT